MIIFTTAYDEYAIRAFTVNSIDSVSYTHLNVAKSGMGLKNLSARYLLICNLHIRIIDDSEYFSVKIPLLNE